MLCPSNILIIILVSTVLLYDITNSRFNYIIQHVLLGGIASFLFYTMCNYGLEQVNWGLLACIPIYLFIVWIYSLYDGECDCGCGVEQTTEKPKKLINPKKTCKKLYTPDLNINNLIDSKSRCPASPINLATACGISRYY